MKDYDSSFKGIQYGPSMLVGNITTGKHFEKQKKNI